MFEKLKELNNIRELQNKIKQEKVTIEKNGVTITLNGAFDMLELKLNPDMAADRLEHLVKECYGKAKEKVQKALAEQMKGQF